MSAFPFLESSAFLPLGEVNLSVLRKWITCLLTALVFLHEEAEQAPIIHGHIQCEPPSPSTLDVTTSSSSEAMGLSASAGTLGSAARATRSSTASTRERATTATWATSRARPCLKRSGHAPVDVYALGMMIVHFVTSQPPYSEEGNKEAILEAIRNVGAEGRVKKRTSRHRG